MLMTDEAYEKTMSLLESRTKNEKDKWTEKEQRLIKELATEFSRTKLYQASKKAFTKEIEILKRMKAEDVFTEMAAKIVCAPTRFHAEGSVILMIPIIDEILEKRRQQK